MNPQQIRLGDWPRLLFGEAPPVFLLEVFLRALVLCPLLLLALRLMGKRMNGQLTLTEMSVLITLGAIMGSTMQLPDRGILQGALALGVAVTFQRVLTLLQFRHKEFEYATLGSAVRLVADGELQLEAMRKARVNREQLFAVLREHRIENLGQVERLYLEACGAFSLFRRDEKQPGLSVLPPGDEVHEVQPVVEFLHACQQCGHTMLISPQAPACPVCRAQKWEAAVA